LKIERIWNEKPRTVIMVSLLSYKIKKPQVEHISFLETKIPTFLQKIKSSGADAAWCDITKLDSKMSGKIYESVTFEFYFMGLPEGDKVTIDTMKELTAFMSTVRTRIKTGMGKLGSAGKNETKRFDFGNNTINLSKEVTIFQ